MNLPRLVLQRRFLFLTSRRPQFGEPPLAMAGRRPAVALAAPGRPPQDLVDVPDAHVQQMGPERADFGDGHRGFFFLPPAAASAAPRTPTPTSTGRCDGANPPSRASRTHRGRIPPCPTGCPPRSSSDCHAPAPAFPTAPPPAH